MKRREGGIVPIVVTMGTCGTTRTGKGVGTTMNTGVGVKKTGARVVGVNTGKVGNKVGTTNIGGPTKGAGENVKEGVADNDPAAVGGGVIGTPPGGNVIGTTPGARVVGTIPGARVVGTPPGAGVVGVPAFCTSKLKVPYAQTEMVS